MAGWLFWLDAGYGGDGFDEVVKFLFGRSKVKPSPKGKIAIVRDFGIALNDDGYHLKLLQRNDRFRPSASYCRKVKVAAAFEGYMALLEDGRILTGGVTREFERHWEIESLRDVVDVVASEGHTVALFRDGTVRSVDEPGGWEQVPDHESVVSDWRKIKQVAVGFYDVMGLTSNGKVLYYSVDNFTDSHFYDDIDNAVQIDCYSHYYGECSSMVFKPAFSEDYVGMKTERCRGGSAPLYGGLGCFGN